MAQLDIEARALDGADDGVAAKPVRAQASADLQSLLETIADQIFNPNHQASPQSRDTPANSAEALRIDATRAPTADWDDPWDTEAADALARLHDQLEPVLTSRPPREPARRAGRPGITTVTPLASSAPASEKAWLEERLAALSSRIEQSVAEMRPESALSTLALRLEQIEDRLGSALAETATRADLDGLAVVEAHIHDLVEQLETSQRQLARLDTVEQQIAGLAEQLGNGRQNSSAQPLTTDALNQMARIVGTIVSDRIAAVLPDALPAAATPATANSNTIDDIRGLLETLVNEQRHGDEQTAGMLDTIQQALIGLLDRVEAFDRPPEPEIDVMPSYMAPGSGPQKVVGTPVSQGGIPASATPHGDDRIAALPRGSASDRSGSSPTRPEASVAPLSGAEPSRDEFVAAARRAMQKAQAQAQNDDAIRPPEPQRGVKDALISRAIGARAGLFAKLTAKPGLDRRVIVAILAFVVLAGAGYQIVRQRALSASKPAAERTILAPEKHERQGAAGALQPLVNGRIVDARGEEAGHEDRVVADEHSPSTPAALSLVGITVHDGVPPSAADLVRLRERQTMAQLSSQLGAAQAYGGEPPRQPGASDGRNQDGASLAGSDGGDVMRGAASSPMPPALIGPLSLRRAAQSGDPSAEFNVAMRFAEGKAVPQDLKQAVYWYQRAASRGFGAAQYRLATMYERGLGVDADLPRAQIWYRRAAEQGSVKAMHNLAVLAAGSSLGKPDYDLAAKWFEAAAEHGLTDSQFNLAVLYESGLGVPKDTSIAYKWLSLAARNGDQQAAKRRDVVRKRLTAAEVSAIDGSLADWQARPQERLQNDVRAAGEAWKFRTAQSG